MAKVFFFYLLFCKHDLISFLFLLQCVFILTIALTVFVVCDARARRNTPAPDITDRSKNSNTYYKNGQRDEIVPGDRVRQPQIIASDNRFRQPQPVVSHHTASKNLKSNPNAGYQQDQQQLHSTDGRIRAPQIIPSDNRFRLPENGDDEKQEEDLYSQMDDSTRQRLLEEIYKTDDFADFYKQQTQSQYQSNPKYVPKKHQSSPILSAVVNKRKEPLASIKRTSEVVDHNKMSKHNSKDDISSPFNWQPVAVYYKLPSTANLQQQPAWSPTAVNHHQQPKVYNNKNGATSSASAKAVNKEVIGSFDEFVALHKSAVVEGKRNIQNQSANGARDL